MLGVDTNVLVRFLTDDDPVQSPLSVRLLTTVSHQPIYVSLPVLVETCLILSRVKKLPLNVSLSALAMLLGTPGFLIEKHAIVADAVAVAEEHRCDINDALIAALNREAGCSTTATFDYRARRLPGMTAVEDIA